MTANESITHAEPTGHELDLAAIRARAEAATPGPWRQEPNTAAGRVWVQMGRHNGDSDLEPLFSVRSRRTEQRPEFAQREADAAHIAGMDPVTTLALVDEVEQLRAVVERVESLATNYESGRHGMQMWVDAACGIRRALATPEPTATEASS